ncbi:MAG: hypothetical protein R3358_03700, partial [Woeseiaceae bacterium]|nr:hypothetical protein [Woeseiaceae bacterium]
MRNVSLVFCALLLSSQAFAASSERNLDRWFDNELIPHVREELQTHPRFRGETVMFVVLDDNAPATQTNALALSLRDRLLDAAVDIPGVTIGWRQGRSDAHFGTESVDCTRDDVHYYIGIEVAQQIDNSYTVSVRALDLAERSWVTGFNKSWSGQISMLQRQALRDRRSDATFLGAREVPFSAAQNDLLAKHLAHELSCALMRQTHGDYVLPNAHPDADGFESTLELVSNNIAANAAIELTSDAQTANARILGKAHHVDGSLFQYWLTITPLDSASGLTTLSASAYVLLPDRMFAAGNDPGERSGPWAAPAVMRETPALPVSRSRNQHGPQTFEDDVVVYYLEHSASDGLLRSGDRKCRDRARAHVVRSGEILDFPIYTPSRRTTRVEVVTEWRTAPLHDTYYAVAVTDERLARRIANHLDVLPVRCGGLRRKGLTGTELEAWLDELAMIAASSAQA